MRGVNSVFKIVPRRHWFDAVLTRARGILPIGQGLRQENPDVDIGPMHAMNVVGMKTTQKLCDLRLSSWLENTARHSASSATHKHHVEEVWPGSTARATRIGWQEER
jgi:hypothetical protein